MTGTLLVAALAAAGCDSNVVAGSWDCATVHDGRAINGGENGTAPAIPASWATGFERAYCDYTAAAGFCYSDPEGSFAIVSSPVHSGASAAAFTITTSGEKTGAQARCVLQGSVPAAAYYSAWFYVPIAASNMDNWNLIHFEGGQPNAPTKLWDVSLATTPNADPRIYIFDFLRGRRRDTVDAPTIPIGAWFRLEFYLKRATDASGAIAVYQDDRLVLELSGLATSDSDWGRWHLGNLADDLMPRQSTIYVDDVAIRTAR